MKASELYKRAAARIDRSADRFTCCAIAHAGDFFEKWNERGYRPKVITQYVETFDDNEADLQYAFEDAQSDGTSPKALRTLALCFMAAIAEDEERAARS